MPTTPKIPLRTRAAVVAGKAASGMSRAMGRGEGMVIGGGVILKISPKAISDLAGGRVAALVSATNGKTSTTKLLATAVEQAGPVVSQETGANMSSGIAMTFASSNKRAQAVLEVDEAWLPKTMKETRPRVVLLGNLSRDQLDRMNEVAMLARLWREMLKDHPEVIVVANADDPMVAFAVGDHEHVVWVSAGQEWTSDSVVCADCGSLMQRIDEIWSCPGCGRRRPKPSWQLHFSGKGARVTGPGGVDLDLSGLQLPGRFNAANAALALAAVKALGLDPQKGLDRMNQVASVSGRYANLQVGDLCIRLLLAKNPAGWSELLDVMPPAPTPVIVTINSDYADGRDPSWLWDVPFEKLRGRLVIATGFRRRDLAVRLTQAEVDHIVVEDPYHGADLPQEVRELDRIDCAATYTAFFHLRTTGVPA